MVERTTDEDLELLEELGVDTAPAEADGTSLKEQRIIAGFREIERFFHEHKRPPQHGEERDIFERLYAVRLDCLRSSTECRQMLKSLDANGLLDAASTTSPAEEPSTDEELLASLGVAPSSSPGSDLTKLVHVRPQADRKAAEEVAQRISCEDFETFRPVFDRLQQDLNDGKCNTVRFQDNGKIEPGDSFVLDGQKVLVAEAGESFMQEFGREDRRLRVIYDNGTESNLLMRSLQRALYKDENGRRILPCDGERMPLFANQFDEEDAQVGVIYILRSRSDHPFVTAHADSIHKIGVTGGEVTSRIANARKDPTYLLADVDLVAEYKLANVNRRRLEALLHRFFANARLDLELKDRFGSQVAPREWFLVPLKVIDEAIQKVMDGSIDGFRYDLKTARIVPA